MKKQQKIDKNEEKMVIFDQKRLIFKVFVAFGVAVAMVFIFGKLAPVAIVSYRLVSHVIGV
ncbi:MAG: hypothetical protein ABS939_14295 [Psychrobacillus sp.]